MFSGEEGDWSSLRCARQANYPGLRLLALTGLRRPTPNRGALRTICPRSELVGETPSDVTKEITISARDLAVNMSPRGQD